MALNDLLLSFILSAGSLDADALADSTNLDTTAYADLTGDNREEKIEFHISYTDTSFCRVFGYDIDNKYKYLLLWKTNLNAFFNYRLFVEDYNGDGISDFTIALPHSEVEVYVTWDKEKGEFIPVFEPLFEVTEGDSSEKED